MIKIKKTPLLILAFIFGCYFCQSSYAKDLAPGGMTIGVELNFPGVIIIGISEVVTINDKKCAPARESGLKIGDIIQKLNGHPIKTAEELTKIVEIDGQNTMDIEVESNNKIKNLKINAQKAKEDSQYKIGAWVKDSTIGIGTMTFYNPETKSYAALGHGITNSDTGKVFKISGGEISKSTIMSVRKGEKGMPGELKGIFLKSGLGTVIKNSECGIFGTLNTVSNNPELLPVGNKSDVKIGEAYILSNVDGEKIEKYKISIQKIMQQTIESSKSMVIKVEDPHLIEKTGGIVQGMSGSPIIQNNKIIGAVTHVFVNDPTRGYGIFIDWMLESAA